MADWPKVELGRRRGEMEIPELPLPYSRKLSGHETETYVPAQLLEEERRRNEYAILRIRQSEESREALAVELIEGREYVKELEATLERIAGCNDPAHSLSTKLIAEHAAAALQSREGQR